MAAWSPTSEKDWARRFGFVAVPLFGKQRSSNQPGNHFVLLDGQRSSLTFSRGDAQSLLKSRRPIEWAWSANVRGSILVDEVTTNIYGVNWDQPSDVREGREADTLLKGIEVAPLLGAETSIARAMDVFRSIRQEVRDYGGRDLDAIHAFTVLLMLVDSIRQGVMPDNVRMLGGVLTELTRQGRVSIEPGTLSSRVAALPIRDLADQLLSGNGPYSLDPYLLMRHASGTLFQEAHVRLAEPLQTQPKLFILLRDEVPRPRGRAQSDIHYTPTSLARFLTEQAVTEFRRLNPNAGSVKVLDPACGSGVFLVEAVRELESTGLAMKITGMDSSPISVAMTRSSVSSALRDSVAAVESTPPDIIKGDSLMQEWGEPDIILMNPPFLPWRRIDSKTRNAIEGSLADLFHGHADTAIAFIGKAAHTLRPGAVMATVLPAALLGSESAAKLRLSLSGPDWRMVVLGRVRGYGYFKDATVEPAFVVISRTAERVCCIRTLMAESDALDRAIRAVRTEPFDKNAEGPGWELGVSSALNADDWNPRPARAKELLRQFSQDAVVRPVLDLFDVHLGIRTGDKHVFVVPLSLVQQMDPTERRFFRPLADTIKRGRIRSPQFLFYPYDDRKLTITSEAQLKSLVPVFYSARLAPNKSNLQEQGRLQGRHWWELARPHLSWHTFGGPRLVSTSFAGREAFAFDEAGEYAVRQGNAWIWKGSRDLNTEEWFVYLAVLNSPIFEAVLDYFCPQMQGGQYEVAKRFLKSVPLPDVTLLAQRKKKQLGEYGRAIHQGKRVPLYSLSASAAAAFGVTLQDFITAFPLMPSARLEMDFEQLASKWKRETAVFSSDAQKMDHPSIRSVLRMGKAAIPLILRELENRPAWWFGVLQTLTGSDPVPPNKKGLLDESAAAWVAWGKENGYEV